VRDEEFDVARGPKVADACAAEMAYQTNIRHDEAGYENEDKRCGPGRNLVRSDATIC
jgi:hypothetical protein